MPTSSSHPLWLKLLTSPVPLVGKWTRRLALDRLSQDIHAGDVQAASALAAGLAAPAAAAIHPEIIQILAGPLPPACRDRLWEEWAARRTAALADALAAQGQPASAQSPAWAISQAWLGRLKPLQNAAVGRMGELVALLHDPDPQLKAVAHAALTGLSVKDSQEELYRLWAAERSPDGQRLGTVDLWPLLQVAGYPAPTSPQLRALYWLKRGDSESLLFATPEMVSFLALALRDPDPLVAALARRSLPFLQDSAAIDALVALWHKERSPLLGEILQEGKLVASAPLALRLLSALKAGREEITRKATLEGLAVLLAALSDPDQQIAQAARAALLALERPATRTALCIQAINAAHPQAAKIALEAGYRPEKPEERALFLFLLEQWDEYDALDFDQRLMRAIYETGAPELRQRIATQVQRSGRTHYLTILAGVDYRARAAHLDGDEAQLMVELLLANREWPRLWPLVQNLALPWSVRILQALGESGWQPEAEAEQVEFTTLTGLARGLSVPGRVEFENVLPPAFARALVRVRGRISDLAFAPDRPLVAIASGAGKLALWNFQTASLERVRQGFNHAISRVTFVGHDYLVCGVRANQTEAPCWIYAWRGDEPFVLNGHLGAVTALEAVGETTLLSSGRDGNTVLWDLASRQEITRRNFARWARNAAVDPTGRQTALVHDSIDLIGLPNLNDRFPDQTPRRVSGPGVRASVAQCAAFAPDHAALVIGDYAGQVAEYRLPVKKSGYSRKVVFAIPDPPPVARPLPLRAPASSAPVQPNRQSLLRSLLTPQWRTLPPTPDPQAVPDSEPIIALHFLPNRNLLVAASRSGRIEFRYWPRFSLAGYVQAGAGSLTSLQISPDGAFMATGTDDSAMQFWDLRILDLPELFELPLGQARPEHMAIVAGLLSVPDLPEDLGRLLELTHMLLARRFRFDIHLDELTQIQAGEFDILLD